MQLWLAFEWFLVLGSSMANDQISQRTHSFPIAPTFRVAWCVSGQTGRFVYREQADLKRFFPSLKRTVRVDAFVVLVDTGSEATVASTGDLAPVPYLNQITEAKVSQYYLDRGAGHAYVELLSPSHVASALHGLETKIVAAFAGQSFSRSGGGSTGSKSSGGRDRSLAEMGTMHSRMNHQNSSHSSSYSGTHSSSHSIRMRNAAKHVYALTREASKQRWPRAGTMLYLRHRAFAAAVAARYPGATATAFSPFMDANGRGGSTGGSNLFPGTTAYDGAPLRRRTTAATEPTHLRPAGNYTHILMAREDNVFLTPHVDLEQLLHQLHDAGLKQTQDLRWPSGQFSRQVAVDEHCNHWGGWSDKIYLADAGGAQALFGSSGSSSSTGDDDSRRTVINNLGRSNRGSSSISSPVDEEGADVDEGFETLAIAWVQHGWTCLNRFPHDHRNAAAAEAVDVDGENSRRTRRSLLSHALGGADGQQPLDWRARKAKREAKEQRSEALQKHDGEVKNRPLPIPKAPPWKPRTASSVANQHPARPRVAPGRSSSSGISSRSSDRVHKISEPKRGRSSNNYNNNNIDGRHSWPSGDLRCRQAEPLQPESFLQYYMEGLHVQIHPVDFMRTEVRFVPGRTRPCVRSLYFKCSPSLAQRPAFLSC